MTEATAARWISLPAGWQQAKVCLLCFPHAGSGAAAYFRWRRLLPAAIAVCPVMLPGRERRLAEPLLTSLEAIVEPVHEAARTLGVPAAGQRLAIFGHSMGSLLAYECARALAADGRLPAHLFVSGREAPGKLDQRLQLYGLDDEALLQGVRLRYGLTADGLLDDPELRAVFLPILRADLTVVESYVAAAGAPLRCPIHALAGEMDRSVSDAGLAQWSMCTQAECTAGRLPGDHFYHTGAGQGALLELLTETLLSNQERRHPE